jgi:predicted secreted hydrolase
MRAERPRPGSRLGIPADTRTTRGFAVEWWMVTAGLAPEYDLVLECVVACSAGETKD